MQPCDEQLELLSARLDDALNAAEQSALNEHLAQCDACRALAEELAAMRCVLPTLAVEVPDGFHQRVMDKIRADNVTAVPVKSRKNHWKSWVSMAAVFAVVLVGAGTVLRQGSLSGGAAVIPQSMTGTPKAVGVQPSPLPEHTAAPADVGGDLFAMPKQANADGAANSSTVTPSGTVAPSAVAAPPAAVAPADNGVAPVKTAPKLATGDGIQNTERSTAPASPPQQPLRFSAENGALGQNTAAESTAPEIPNLMTTRADGETAPPQTELVALVAYLGGEEPLLTEATLVGAAEVYSYKLTALKTLEYVSISPNNKYQIFRLTQAVPAPESDATPVTDAGTVQLVENLYAVPLNGGAVVPKRPETETSAEAYNIAWEAYRMATEGE